MRQFALRKSLVGVVLACLLSFGVIAVYASGTSNPVHACLAPGGVLKVVSDPSECKKNETVISLASSGDVEALQLALETESAARQAADEALANRIAVLEAVQHADPLTSPDGEYSITVTDDGIHLSGPASEVEMNAAGVSVNGTMVQVHGSLTTMLSGGLLQLNCTTGGSAVPVARQGDMVTGVGGLGSFTGSIVTGSPTILAC